MTRFLHIFLLTVIATFSYCVYASFYRGLAEKQYEAVKNLKIPASLIARRGKHFFIIYYRVAVIIALLLTIGLYIVLNIYLN